MIRDKHTGPLLIGDEIYHYIPGIPGGYALVIGAMAYAGKGDQVICVATEEAHGMPINTRHVEFHARGPALVEQANTFRERYLDMYPNTLKPLDTPREQATMFTEFDHECIPGN